MKGRGWRLAAAAVLGAATLLGTACRSSGGDEGATPPATVQGQAVAVSRAKLAARQDHFAWRQKRIGELETAVAHAASLEERQALQTELDHAKAQAMNPPAWPLTVDRGWVEARGEGVVFHDGTKVYALDPAVEGVEPIAPLLRPDLGAPARADGLAWLRAQAGR